MLLAKKKTNKKRRKFGFVIDSSLDLGQASTCSPATRVIVRLAHFNQAVQKVTVIELGVGQTCAACFALSGSSHFVQLLLLDHGPVLVPIKKVDTSIGIRHWPYANVKRSNRTRVRHGQVATRACPTLADRQHSIVDCSPSIISHMMDEKRIEKLCVQQLILTLHLTPLDQILGSIVWALIRSSNVLGKLGVPIAPGVAFGDAGEALDAQPAGTGRDGKNVPVNDSEPSEVERVERIARIGHGRRVTIVFAIPTIALCATVVETHIVADLVNKSVTVRKNIHAVESIRFSMRSSKRWHAHSGAADKFDNHIGNPGQTRAPSSHWV